MKPIKKNRMGRFQISIWRKKRVIAAKNDYDVEREIETVRACIQYGRKNRETGQWDNRSIWCNCDELTNLAQILDQFNNEPSETDGSEA